MDSGEWRAPPFCSVLSGYLEHLSLCSEVRAELDVHHSVFFQFALHALGLHTARGSAAARFRVVAWLLVRRSSSVLLVVRSRTLRTAEPLLRSSCASGPPDAFAPEGEGAVMIIGCFYPLRPAGDESVAATIVGALPVFLS